MSEVEKFYELVTVIRDWKENRVVDADVNYVAIASFPNCSSFILTKPNISKGC